MSNNTGVDKLLDKNLLVNAANKANVIDEPMKELLTSINEITSPKINN